MRSEPTATNITGASRPSSPREKDAGQTSTSENSNRSSIKFAPNAISFYNSISARWPRNPRRPEARREFLFTLLLAGVLAAAGLALAVLLANGIMRPVRELTATATRIAGGDLTAKARVTSRDEIGILAAEFNRMAERIQQLRRSDL